MIKLNPFSRGDKTRKARPAKKEPVEVSVAKEETTPVETAANVGFYAGASVLKNIYVSEKSTRLIGLNQYVFKVTARANKSEIKKEVATRYNVKVKDVKVMNVQGKRRDIGRHPGTRPGYRKAIVVLEVGSSIAQAKP